MDAAHTTFQTLETHLNESGMLNLNDAIDMAVRILCILDYCHGRNMTHNNLSPSKVVVENGQPTLIDFSFPINGHNGNSSQIENFLELPEHQVNLNAAKRDDTVSDVTAVAGLLLYALTGDVPQKLKDDEGRMPHQRPNTRAQIDHVAGYRSFLINQLFDKAFQWQQSERYKDSVELMNDLSKLRNYKPSTLPIKNLADIVTTIRSETQSQTLTPIEMRLQTAFIAVKKVCGEVVTALEEDFREMSAGYRKEVSRPLYTAYLRFNYRLEEKTEITLLFRIEIVGSEIVVSGKTIFGKKETEEELYRTEHFSFQETTDLEHSVREFVAANMASFLSNFAQ